MPSKRDLVLLTAGAIGFYMLDKIFKISDIVHKHSTTIRQRSIGGLGNISENDTWGINISIFFFAFALLAIVLLKWAYSTKKIKKGDTLYISKREWIICAAGAAAIATILQILQILPTSIIENHLDDTLAYSSESIDKLAPIKALIFATTTILLYRWAQSNKKN